MHSGIASGGTMPNNTSPLPEWEQVLSSAAHLGLHPLIETHR